MDNKKLKKNKNKSNKVIVILTSLFITSTIGSLTGTYAWFEYSARARLAYHGTAISEHKILEIGLWSPVELKDAIEYNLYQDPLHPNIYWSSTVIDANTMKYYSEITACASNKLSPTTSGQFSENGEFALKPAPSGNEKYDPNARAKTNQFVHIPLRFRAKEGLSLGDGNQMIVLNKVNMDFSGEAYEGARIHFKGPNSDFIFNPSSKIDGSTFVGGPLDLNDDGYFDYDLSTSREICYGSFEENELVYLDEKSTNKTPYEGEDRSCFISAHAHDVYMIDMQNSNIHKAQYFGLDSTLLKKELTRMTPYNRIAELDMDIYVEGWQDTIVNQRENDSFSLDLTFEIQEF